MEVSERGKTVTLRADEHPRPGSTLEALARLPLTFPVVEGQPGIITAGTASGITDGGAAVVLSTATWAKAHGVTPLARLLGWASAGVDPRIMGIGPVPALHKLKARIGLGVDDVDLVELNEAFAAQVLAVTRDVPIAPEKLNVNGGAIALGHPIGCTGTRIVVTLLHELRAARRVPRHRHAVRQRRDGDGVGDRGAVMRPAPRWQGSGTGASGEPMNAASMRIAVIPGDGIGKDVTAEAVKVLQAVCAASGKALDLEPLPWSADHYLATGETLPAHGYRMLRDEFDAVLVGALGDPRVPDNRHARDILLGTRFELDLYVNYRPVKLLDDRLCPLKDRGRADVNFVVFRENTEGVYVSVGGRFKAGTEDEVAIQEEINTWKGVHRIVRHAFQFAAARGLTRVCMADKSNAMQQGHALWQRVFKDVAAEFPGITATPSVHRRAGDVPGQGSRRSTR